MHRRLLPLIPFVLLLIASPLDAQEGEEGGLGRVTGRVTSAHTGEPLAAANIVLRGTGYGAATDLDGNYTIRSVPPGIYAVQASVLGYETLVRPDIVVSPARPAEVDFQLQPGAVQLETVTVTAGFFKRDGDRRVSTAVQSAEEIRRLPGGFEDVVRAVSILPGVAQVSAGRNDLVVRGGAPSENLFLVEGLEVPNINHFGTQGATGGPQSFINIDYVDRTTFSTGGFGVRYGDKLSSVLSIDLRDGRSDRIGGKATISATQFGASIEGPIPGSEGGSFAFSARRSYLDLIFRAADFGFVPEYWDFLATGDIPLGERDRLSLVALCALDNVRLFNDTREQRVDNSDIPASDQTTGAGGVTWKHLFGRGFTTVTVGQTTQDFETVQRDFTSPGDTLLFRNIAREYETSLRGEVLWNLTDATELTFGTQVKRATLESDILLPSFETTYGPSIGLDTTYSTATYKSALYGQVSQDIGPLNITGGLRLNHFELIEEPWALSPRLSASYAINRLTRLNASLGRYHQGPSYIWLAASEQNRELEHIRADQLVLGVERILRSDLRISLEGYLKQYSNYPASTTRPWLVLANTGVGFGGTEDNFASFGFDPLVSAGEGWSRGFELYGQKKAAENPHYAIASLSYSETRFTAFNGEEYPGAFDQRWIFTVGAGFIINQRSEISGKFRLTTGRPYTPWEPDGTQDPAEYFSERTGVNHQLDLRYDRRWFFDNLTLIAYVDVQNVYGHQYDNPPRWDEEEQRPVQNQNIGVLPSIGVSVEF